MSTLPKAELEAIAKAAYVGDMSRNPEHDVRALLEHIESLTSALEAAQKLEGFGKEIWDYFKQQWAIFDLDEGSEDILPIAEKFGLAMCVSYDPAIHGEHLKNAEDFQAGDDIWVWGKVLEAHNSIEPPKPDNQATT